MNPLVIFTFYIYFMASVLVGFLGRNRMIGFLGFFIVSVLITPVLSALVLALTSTKRPA